MEENSVIETTKDNVKIITFNRPNKKNAMNLYMYKQVTKILNNAATDENISMVVITGNGDFYSSGNDFVSSANIPIDIAMQTLTEYIEAFITFPKMLFAIVNGPAIGIAATTLPFCDFVFASEKAYLYTPFTKLGIVAEACSTLTFPKLMGDRKAMEMLILNYKMPAKEAAECGLVSYVYKQDQLKEKAWDKISEISNLPQNSVLIIKKLMRRIHMDELLKTNRIEIQELARLTKNISSKL